MMEVLSTGGKVAIAAIILSTSLAPQAVAQPGHNQVRFTTVKAENQANFRGRKVDRVVTSSPGQAYFWTERWQAGEKAADEDFKRERYETFESAEDAIKWLFGEEA